MELHKPQVRKRTALISHARFGRRGALLEDARLAGFLRRKDDDGRNARPMRRKAKNRKAALEWFKIKVTASAASVSYRGPGLSRIDPDGDADSVIKIEGTLDRPVLKRATAFMYVFCGATVGDNPGSAIGATTAWQLVVRLPREQFTDLLVIITAQRLVEVDLLLEGLSRGKGKVRSASFYTAPVPYERDEDVEET